MRMAWRVWMLALFGIGCGDDETVVHAGEPSDSSGGGSGSSSETGGPTSVDGDSGGADESSSTGAAPPIPGDGPFGGGARLRAVVEHGDGAARLLHWFDTELGIECEFARDAAGDLRCLPVQLPGVQVGYADDDCAEAVLQTASCGAAPGFVRGDAVGAAQCDTGPRQVTFRRGGPIPAPEHFGDWSPITGECGGGSPPVGDHYALDRVDDDDFLAAVFVDEDVGGVLGVRSIVAEDGSWERAQLLDVGTGLPCSPSTQVVDGESVAKCLIARYDPYSALYAGADCSGDPLIHFDDDGTCNLPPFTNVGDDWWSLGPRYEGETYGVFQNVCTAYPIDLDAAALFERGDAIEAPTFADYTRAAAPEAEGDRLQLYGVVLEGAPVPLTRIPWDWYDATLDAPCSAVALADGGHICAHETMNGPPRQWGDAECAMIPLAHSFTSVPAPIVVRVEFDGCREIAQDASAVFGEWTEAVYELDRETDECTPSDDAENSTFLQLGSSVQLADLPPLVIETLD